MLKYFAHFDKIGGEGEVKMDNRPTFADIYIDKIYGEVNECDSCYGSGIFHKGEKLLPCEKCTGKGFVKMEQLSGRIK